MWDGTEYFRLYHENSGEIWKAFKSGKAIGFLIFLSVFSKCNSKMQTGLNNNVYVLVHVKVQR